MTIGERLEEARKRKGVSIREAAEATKIRGDYLMSMEDNSLDIPLPEIYKRGFLKNYARFLKLDPEKILTDYDAQQIGRRAASSSPHHRETIGRMEVPEEDGDDEKDEASAPARPSKHDQRLDTPPPPTLERESAREIDLPRQTDNTLYVKIAVVFAGFLSLIALLVLLITMITRDEETPELNPELAETTENVADTPATTPSRVEEPGSSNTVTLTATDNVTVIVEQTSDRQRLWQGTLNAGETIQLEKQGPVSIRFTSGQALMIEANGRQLRPDTPGVGRTLIQ